MTGLIRKLKKSGHFNNKIWLRRSKNILILVTLLLLITGWSFKNQWTVPKTWDIEALEEAHLPPPDSTVNINYSPESYYNSLPEHVIYKTYPVYLNEHEPPGYIDSLKGLEPQVAFDPNEIKTREDWIKAEEQVFFWPVDELVDLEAVRSVNDSSFIRASGDRLTNQGIFPFTRYVIKDKGRIQEGGLSCADCHTRVTEKGEVIIGAQGNVAMDRGFAYVVVKFNLPEASLNAGVYRTVGAPWAPWTKDSVMAQTRAQYLAELKSRPGGAMARQGMAYNLPIKVPDLIGLREIKYLDHTGLMRHRGPEDLMRYAALNQGMDMLTNYNGFIPLGTGDYSVLPGLEEWSHPFGYAAKRYSDAQLYALAQYIYSLKPPENPNHFPKEILDRGELLFAEEGCVTCHSPPLYTNNMLTPVNGFDPPKEHFEKYDIFNVSVETDSISALYSRRGTGYYKIPSLRGVWYRGPFFHNGELANLEDVLDPARLEADYVPTGYKPPDLATKAVKGHDFGMDLSPEDKQALVSFLKTL